MPSARDFHDEQSTATVFSGPRLTSAMETDWSGLITAPPRSIGSANAQGSTVAFFLKSFASHPIA